MPRRSQRVPRVVPITGPERWALALLLLGPVLIMPGGLNRFVFPKVAVVAAGAAVAAACPARGRLPRLAVYLLGGGAALLVIAAAVGAAPLAQLIGRGPRYEGVVVLPVYLAAGLAGARLLGPGRGAGAAEWTGRVLAVAAIAVGVLAVLEAAGLRPLSTNVARPGSLFGNASDEGGFGVLAAGPLAALALARRDKLTIAGAVAAVVIAGVSASRAALLGAVVATALLVWLLRTRGQRLLVVGGLAALAVLALALPATRSRALGSSRLATHTVHGRVLLWRETLSLVAHHPLLGVGPSGFEDAIGRYHTLSWERKVGPANPPDSPDDAVLQAAAAGGIPLALLALLLAGYTGWRGLSAARGEPAGRGPPLATGMLAGLAAYAVVLSVQLTSPGPTSLAALYGGALLAEPAVTRIGRSWLRPIMVTWPAVLAAVLVLAAFAEIPLRAAIVAMGRGNLTRAEHDFGLARDLRPWDVEIDLTAGHAYAVEALGGSAAAAGAGLHWLMTAHSRVPDSEQVLEDLAAVRAARSDYPAAAQLLDRALTADPHNPELLLRRGVIYAEQQQYPAAIRLLRQVTEIDPTSPEPWTDLSIVYQQEHQTAASRQAAAEAARLAHPGSAG